MQPSAQPSSLPSGQPTVQPTTQPSAQPTSTPSSQPTSVPTAQPSVQPTARPSLQPSTQPTSQPSTQPSGRPSCQPSAQPSSYPTPIPSQYRNLTEWQVRLHKEVVNATVGVDSGITQLLYSELYFDYSFDKGGCTDWLSFLKSVEMKNAVNILRIKSVSVETIKLMYDYYETIDRTPESEVCSDSAIASSIVQRLAFSDTTSSNFSAMCNGTHWQIKNCVSQSPSVCVNCVDPCAVHCSNSRAVHFVSSCKMDGGYCEDTLGRRNGLKYIINMLSVTAVERNDAPSIVSIVPTPQRTSTSVAVQLSGAGGAYCAAYPSGKTPAALDQIRLSGVMGYTTSGALSLDLGSLSPCSAYKVYCFTFAASGATMSYDALLLQGVQAFSTLCPKYVTVRLSSTVVFAGSQNVGFLHVDVEVPPSSDLSISIGVSPGSTGQAFFPTVVSVVAQSPLSALHQAMALDASALSIGTYTLAVTLSGTSQGEFAIQYADSSNTFTVLAVDDVPPAPVLLSAQYSAAGDVITVRFDVDTDRAGATTSGTRFVCSTVLSFTGAGSHTCAWVDDLTVAVYIKSTAALSSVVGIAAYNAAAATATAVDVGDSISVASDVVRAKCRLTACTGYPSVQSSVTVSAPTASPGPKWIISAPRTVSKCDGFTLDLTGSSNFAGGPFLNFAVAVTSSTASLASVNAVQTYIQASYVFHPPSVIPASLLEKAAEYTFVVSGCSLLNVCSSAAHTVYVSNATAPYVVIEGSPLRSVRRDRPLVLQGQAYMRSTCESSPSKRSLLYSWQVKRAGIVVPTLVSDSNNPAVFRLSSHRLEVGEVYYVHLTAQDSVTGYSTQSYTVVYVESADLVAVVAGGAERTVTVNKWFNPSALGSYDANFGYTTQQTMVLQYSWSCQAVSPNLADMCDASLFDTVTDVSGVLQVRPLTSNVTAVFTVLVSSRDDRYSNRSATASVTVRTVDAAHLPLTAYAGPYNAAAATRLGENSVVVNPAEKVKLAGIVTLEASALSSNSTQYALWSVNDSTVDVSLSSTFLQSAPYLSLSDYLPMSPVAAAVSVPFHFVLAGGALTAGASYKFTLSVGQLAASVVVTVNTPPAPGVFTVSPIAGTKLSTPFTLLAYSWQDTDLPLRYQFGFVAAAGSFVSFAEPLELSYAVTTLPAVTTRSSDNAATDCVTVVYVTDSYAANNSATVTVQVTDVVESGQNVFTALYDALDDATNDPRALQRVLGLYSTSLSSVDCSQAPNCEGLSRQACSGTINTCGPCLGNSTGIAGDSNSACLPTVLSSANNARRVLHEGTGDHCHAAGDCADPFAQCVQNHCSTPAKSCPFGAGGAVCSGRGACVFVNTDSNDIVGSCLVSDLYCHAKCVCDPSHVGGVYSVDYTGDACEVSPSDYESNVQSRLLLTRALTNLTAYGDYSADTVSTWVTMTELLTTRGGELSADAVVELTGLMHQALYAASVASVPQEYYKGLTSCVSSLLSALAESKSYGGYNAGWFAEQSATATDLQFSLDYVRLFETVLDAYTATVAGDLAVGQSPSTALWSDLSIYLRTVPAVLSTEGRRSIASADAAVVLPISAMERVLHAHATALTVPHISTSNGNDDTVIVSVYAFRGKLFSSAALINQSLSYEYTQGHLSYRSSPLRVRVTSLSGRSLALNCSAANGTSSGCESTVVLQYNQYAPFIEPWENITYTTCYDQDYRVFDYPCLTRPGANLTIACPSTAGLIVDRCPIYNVTTVCNTLVNKTTSIFAYSADTVAFNYSSCSVESFTAFNVTCTCRYDVDGATTDPAVVSGGSRRLETATAHNSTAQVLNFTALSVSYAAQARLYVIPFDQTFTRDPYYRSPYTSRIVFISMGSFAALVLILSIASFGNDMLVNPKASYKAHKAMTELDERKGGRFTTMLVGGKQREVALLTDDTKSRIAQHRRPTAQPGPSMLSVTMDTVIGTLPVIYQQLQESTVVKLWRELRVYHRWLSILAHYSRRYSRAYRIVALVFQVLIPLFLCAVIYAVLDPDDGECKQIDNERDCIADLSTYVTGYKKCIWYTTDQSCAFRQPQQSFETVLLVTFTAALVSVPVARAVELMLEKICIPAAREEGDEVTPRTKPSGTQDSGFARWPHLPKWLSPWRTSRTRQQSSDNVSEDGSGDGGIYKYTANNTSTGPAGLPDDDFTIEMNVVPAMRRGTTLSAADRVTVRNALNAQIYSNYPVTLFVRRALGLPVPVRFLPVDFIDGVSVKQELDILQSRVQHYSGRLRHEGRLAENKKLLGK
jgi:hypothetical protein